MALYLDNTNHWTNTSRALTDEERKQIMLDAHPVHSYYFSEDSTSPAILFGGQWEPVHGRFLYCTEQGQSAGVTGGAKTVTLTTNQMPAHSHSGGSHTHSASASDHSHSLGGHNHSLNSHTHSLNSHTHSLNSHTHSLNSHTHSLSSHTHTMNHYHSLSNAFPGGSPCGINLSRYGTRVGSGLAGGVNFSSFGTTPNVETSGYSGSTGGPSKTNTGSSSGNTGASSGSTGGPSQTNTGSATGNTGNATGNTGTSSVTVSVNSATVSVNSAGGGQAHENMPPYITVYCWKRTA